MKKVYLLLFVLCHLMIQGQTEEGKYFVYFNDKPDMDVNHPEQFLSKRAIQRRAKYGIPIQKRDFPVNPEYVLNLKNLDGVEVLNVSKWLNGTSISISHDLNYSLTDLPFVKEVVYVASSDSKKRSSADRSADKLSLGADYSIVDLKNTQSNETNYGEAELNISSIHGTTLHQEGYKGEGMLIAVMDAGFVDTDQHFAFTKLRNENRIIATRDFVHPNRQVDIYNESVHGTSVLSTMASDVKDYYVGTAPNANYALIRTENRFAEELIEEFNWVSGAEYADSLGVDVLNSSLSYVDFDNPIWDHPYSEMDGKTTVVARGAAVAADCGILIVTSNGNDGNDNNYRHLGSPADAFNVLAVGAVDRDLEYASFSSLGYTFDGRVNPGVVAFGKKVMIAYQNNKFATGSGTSYSSPIIAGMATCLLQKYPLMSNTLCIELLEKYATNSDEPNPKIGYGIPNIQKIDEYLQSQLTIIGEEELGICVYPNPCYTSHIKVSALKTILSPSVITIRDVYGSILKTERVYIKEGIGCDLSVDGLPVGLYLIDLELNNRVIRKKFVLAK